MNRRLTAKSKAKLRMGSGSWQVMNSAQEPKLLGEFRTHFDKKKEKNAVQDSLTELNVQLEDTTSEKKLVSLRNVSTKFVVFASRLATGPVSAPTSVVSQLAYLRLARAM
ncbi:hypothetical protein C1H46_034588 [Malus baccata]|uniref:Uncharacterized protein n=1 Tax=Malus baccata TaxID=106549 RepID=A0A540L067_MALBA|nr:hypothetical protein C1H46_034588 [Malus baccata]